MKYLELTLILLTIFIVWKIFTSKKIDTLLHRWFGKEETADDILSDIKKAEESKLIYVDETKRKMSYTMDDLKKVLDEYPETAPKKKRVYKKKSTG